MLGLAVFDFFFVPPYLTFAVADTQYLITFAVMLTVGLVISTQAARVRQQALAVTLREQRTAEVTRQIRSWSAVPIIILSARDQERDKVHALDAGADDYLTKPFAVHELLARVRVALRHAGSGSGKSAVLLIGELAIDQERRLVRHAGEEGLRRV